MEKLFFIGFFIMLILTKAVPVYAYLDLGSGSMLIYVLLGILVALVHALRGTAYKVKDKKQI